MIQLSPVLEPSAPHSTLLHIPWSNLQGGRTSCVGPVFSHDFAMVNYGSFLGNFRLGNSEFGLVVVLLTRYEPTCLSEKTVHLLQWYTLGFG